MSTVDSSEDKKANLIKLREFHKATLDELGVENPSLLGKMCYLSPRGEKIISFFHSEVSKGQDVYIEFTNRFNVPEDIERTLYQWKFNPHFDEEYDKVDENDPSRMRYCVPIDELKVIKKYSQTANISTKTEKKEIKQPANDFGLIDPSSDPPLNEMTIRDLAAIMLAKPVSNKEWLNDIIKQKK